MDCSPSYHSSSCQHLSQVVPSLLLNSEAKQEPRAPLFSLTGFSLTPREGLYTLEPPVLLICVSIVAQHSKPLVAIRINIANF